MPILREDPKWKDVLGYDEFKARVVIRERPPWGEEAADTTWTDHHELLTRVRFQSGYRMTPTMVMWASGTDGGEAQPIPSGPRPFRVAGLGWSVSPGLLVANVPARRGQRIRPRNRAPLSHFGGCPYLSPRRKVDHMLVLEGRRGGSNQRRCERWPLTIAGSRIGSVTLAAKMRPWKPLAS